MMKPLWLLALACAAIAPTHAPAQTLPPATSPAPAAAPAVTPMQAQQALDILQDPQKRDQLIAVLRTIATAAPGAAPAPGTVTLTADSLGAQLLVELSRWSARLSTEAAATAKAMTDFPALWRWLVALASDPARATALLIALGWLALVLGGALGLEFLGGWLLRRPRAALFSHLPRGDGDSARLLRLLPFAVIALGLDLVPVAVFAATGNLLVGLVGEMGTRSRLVVLAVINAYAVCRAVMCVARMLVSPDSRRLRLWRLDDADARFVIVWLRRSVAIAVFGDAVVEAALLLGLDRDAHDGLDRLITLALAVLAIVVVIRSRRDVAGYIRGAAADPARWRAWLAEAWPYLGVIAVISAWIGLATGARGGLTALYFPAVTLATVVVARLAAIVAVGGIARLLRFDSGTQDKLPGFSRRIGRYRRPLELAAVAAIGAVAIVVLLQLWGAPAFAWFAAGGIGRRLVSAVVTLAIAVIAAIAIWEVSQALLQRQLDRFGNDGNRSRSARLLTLLPMLRMALLALILTIVGLTALSEIGVNIAPLLAGAGIAGIAIGFGSQRLVQDVITGMFVVVENAIQIGDTVTAAGLTGTVEALSIRTVRLRAPDGAVHIIPFSTVTSITNNNRGLGNAAVSVTVVYETDTDRVCGVLGEIAAELREDPDFAPQILDDLKLFGVDQVRPWGVTITGQIACTDTGRWPVQREFNRRVKRRFEELEIALGAAPGAAA